MSTFPTGDCSENGGRRDPHRAEATGTSVHHDLPLSVTPPGGAAAKRYSTGGFNSCEFFQRRYRQDSQPRIVPAQRWHPQRAGP